MSKGTRTKGVRPTRAIQPKVVIIIVIVGLILVSGPSLYQEIFAIQKIEISGNSFYSDDQVIEASGIRPGVNIFSVNTDQVREKINADRYLEFVDLQRNYFPASLVLTVEEHTPRAKIMWMGMLLIIGDNGVVLERTSMIDQPVYVPEIVGMTIESVVVGEPLLYEVPGQRDAIERILDVLDAHEITNIITQINIATPDNLSLQTEQGIQVILGDDDMLPEKIALMRDMLPPLHATELAVGGVLNVSSGTSADFRPVSR